LKSRDDHRQWCKGRVELEDLFKLQDTMLDVWPAGWTTKQIEDARAIGRAAIDEEKRARSSS
jgi:hypothetical protein